MNMIEITPEELLRSVKAVKPLTEKQMKIAQETMKKIQTLSPKELNNWLDKAAEDEW